MKSITKILLFTILLVSFVLSQPQHSRYILEIGGGTSYLMPRMEFSNAWGFKAQGFWYLSPRYALGINYSSTTVDTKDGGQKETIATTGATIEVSFRRGDPLTSFTTLGMSNLSVEEGLLFVLGFGIRIPLGEKWLLRLSLRDYQTDLGIPFVTFPGGHVAVQGSGSNYLELGVTIYRKLLQSKSDLKNFPKERRRRFEW
ncbi:MAG: hypothetical protein ACE5EE_07725 [Fidelibacterota bacterium]